MHATTGRSSPPGKVILAALLSALLALGSATTLAAGGVQDDAGMFSPATRDQATALIAQIHRDTGKTVAVVTVPSLGGRDVSAAADEVFAQQRLNGILLFIARDDRKLAIKVGVATRSLISVQEEAAIRDTILAHFRQGEFDQGLLAGLERIGTDLRNGVGSTSPTAPGVSPLILLALVAGVVLVVGLIVRLTRPTVDPARGWESSSLAPVAPSYSSGGWFGTSGSGFFSGLLGSLAGALVGNALFDWFRGHEWRGPDRGFAAPPEPAWSSDDAGIATDSSADVGSWGESGSDLSDSWGGDPGSDAGNGGSGSDW